VQYFKKWDKATKPHEKQNFIMTLEMKFAEAYRCCNGCSTNESHEETGKQDNSILSYTVTENE